MGVRVRGACSSTAAEGGWGEHCTGLCKMVVDTAEKGMREGRNCMVSRRIQ